MKKKGPPEHLYLFGKEKETEVVRRRYWQMVLQKTFKLHECKTTKDWSGGYLPLAMCGHKGQKLRKTFNIFFSD
jgi:hypothetical protein